MSQHQQNSKSSASTEPAPKTPDAGGEGKKSLFKRLLAWLIKGAEANASSGCST